MGHLLAYLAYHPKTHRREALIEHFWPEEDFEVARNRFRVDLSRLRDVLSELGLPDKELLVANREQVALKLAICDCDVSYFEALLKAARTQEPVEQQATLAQAVALYTGPLLPGHDEDWVLGERQRLQELAVGALRQLVQFAWKQAKDLDLALDYARRTVLLDPLQEEAHQDVLRLLLELRRPVVAREHYHRFVGKLRTELGCGPLKETEALLLEIQKQLHHGAELPREGKAPRQNVPRVNTRFFGRHVELEQLTHALAKPGALVSLIGFGGLGKTRLALELASVFTHALPFWVPLADVLATDSLWNTLAGHLNQQTTLPPAPPSLSAGERVVAVLKGQAALLVLDNTEHLRDAALAEVLTTLRQQIPELRCLVTSRRRLGLADEQVIALEPLSGQEGAELFVDRAARTRSGFVLTPRNQETIATLCTRLEGIPLAIEMAAARVSVLTPSQILARLDKRFSLLVNQNKDVPTRHRTLEATLDWSYRLLTASQQRFLCTLSVFRGGWTLDAAETLSEDGEALEHTQALVDASLIQTKELESADGSVVMRYYLLETVRQFSENHLTDTERTALALRHGSWLHALVREVRGGGDPHTYVPLLDQENENLVAASTRLLLEQLDSALGVQLICLLDNTWGMRGRDLEGFEWSYTALQATRNRPELLSQGARLIASACHEVRDAALLPHLIDEAQALLLHAQTSRQRMEIQDALGYLHGKRPDMPAAREHFWEGDRQRRASDMRYTPIAGTNIADTYLCEGNFEAALETLAHFGAFLEPRHIRVGFIFQVVTAQVKLGLKQYDEASVLLRKSLAAFEAIPDQEGISRVKVMLAGCVVEQGHFDEAARLAREGGRVVWRVEDAPYIQSSLKTLALCALQQGNPRRAWALLGIGDKAREERLPFPTAYIQQENAEFKARFPADTEHDYVRGVHWPAATRLQVAYTLPESAQNPA